MFNWSTIFIVQIFHVTLRQRILRSAYPFFVFYKRIRGENKILHKKAVTPPLSFYNLTLQLNDGNNFSFENLRGKKVMIVNTASNCGYTNQYAELEQLFEYAKEELTIIAFPANDFKEQEAGSDEEIARFCQLNYGVSFPLAKKSSVVKGTNQNKVFEWLTHKQLNGWNDKQPPWNFSKYLVDKQGHLTHYFDPAVSPLSEEVLKALRS